MARSSLTPVVPFDLKGTLSANAADLTWTAATGSSGNDGNQFLYTGREIILIKNAHATDPFTVTFTSIADAQNNRTGDKGPYTLQAGEIAAVVPYLLDGWLQSGGLFFLEANSTSIQFCILKPKQLL